MELRAFITEALSAGTELNEVFSGLGHDIIIQNEVDPASLICIDLVIENRHRMMPLKAICR